MTTTTTIMTAKPTEKEIVIIDFRGKVITLKKPVERILVLTSYWAEIFVVLGACDKIVGIGSCVTYDDYLP